MSSIRLIAVALLALPAAGAIAQAVVSKVSGPRGSCEFRGADIDAGWVVLAASQALPAGHRVRCKRGGEAVLTMGTTTQVVRPSEIFQDVVVFAVPKLPSKPVESEGHRGGPVATTNDFKSKEASAHRGEAKLDKAGIKKEATAATGKSERLGVEPDREPKSKRQ